MVETSSHWGFEGPEKILEAEFDVPKSCSLGARQISREAWDSILLHAQCLILSKTSNESFDAYVLSESSLFVYREKVFIKTCGTTTLLKCLPLLLNVAAEFGLDLQWLGYTRKNYIFPDKQVYPHCSFEQELRYAETLTLPSGEALNGHAYVLGDLQSDHWYVYVADVHEDIADSSDRNVNIMMYDLDPVVCNQFFRHNELSETEDAARVTEETGIRQLCPNAVIDDSMFTPCGYSMNALEGKHFYTVHVTPEKDFSYASFETNLELDDYTDLVERVLQVFNPSRVIVTMFADDSVFDQIHSCPTHLKSLLHDDEKCCHIFKRETQCSMIFRDNYACRLAVYLSSKDSQLSSSGESSSVVSSEEE